MGVAVAPPFCTCYGGVRQWDPDLHQPLCWAVGVLGQRIEIPHTPVGLPSTVDLIWGVGVWG